MTLNDENIAPSSVPEINCTNSNYSDDSSYTSVQASKVFGDILFDDNDAQSTNSLCYSPSPMIVNKRANNLTYDINPRGFTFETTTMEPNKIRKTCSPEPSDRSMMSVDSPFRVLSDRNSRMVGDADRCITKARSFEVGALRREKPTYSVATKRYARQRKHALASEKAQNAIDAASDSVNQSLQSIRAAKRVHDLEKKTETARMKELWREEREMATALRAEADKAKAEMLRLRANMSVRASKAKADRERQIAQARRDAIEKESLFKSKVYREHKRELKEERDRKKRMSVDERAKLRHVRRQGEERLKLAKIEEDQALFDERHESSLAKKETEAKAKEDRRRSYAFRSGDAKRIRELHADMKAKQLKEQHESYELKWEGEKDAEAYAEFLSEQRRKSLAIRNEDGRRQREMSEDVAAEERAAEHESYELKWSGDKDAENYGKYLAEQRRKSLAIRNEDGRRQREMSEDAAAEERAAEHESYELKWLGDKDAENYGKYLAEQRRKSLAIRNEDGRRQREMSEDAAAEERAAEHENYELKWSGDKDAENYGMYLAQKRRESLALRNEEGHRQRELQEQLEAEKRSAEHESFELKWAAEKDAENHLSLMAQKRRESLAVRNQEGHRQRDLQDQLNAERRAVEHEEYELKWAGDNDAELYSQFLAQKRRESLALRNEEGHRQRETEEQIQAEKAAAEHESLELKWKGQKDAEHYQAQLADQRRRSLALRNEAGRHQREQDEDDNAEERAREHASYEVKWAGERDAENYQRFLAAKRRESLARRNEEGHRQRSNQEQRDAEERVAEHENYELKWAGDKDAEDYERSLAEHRRESLALRNEESRRQREVEEEIEAQRLAVEKDSLELKWAGQKDAEAYEGRLAEERRNSLEFRNEEGRRHRAVMDELEAISKQKEHESLLLKWAGEDDMQEYELFLKDDRRKSLAIRNKEGERHRIIDEVKRRQEIHNLAEEEKLQAACHDDVKKYKKECAARDRASLLYRRKEAHIHRIEEEGRRQMELQKEQEGRLLDAQARDDVDRYVKTCKDRRRLSLAFRAKEKRRHHDWEKEQAEKERAQRSFDTRARSVDSMYVELAKEKERARVAMENLRHAQRSFSSSNPFASLLD